MRKIVLAAAAVAGVFAISACKGKEEAPAATEAAVETTAEATEAAATDAATEAATEVATSEAAKM